MRDISGEAGEVWCLEGGQLPLLEDPGGEHSMVEVRGCRHLAGGVGWWWARGGDPEELDGDGE